MDEYYDDGWYGWTEEDSEPYVDPYPNFKSHHRFYYLDQFDFLLEEPAGETSDLVLVSEIPDLWLALINVGREADLDVSTLDSLLKIGPYMVEMPLKMDAWVKSTPDRVQLYAKDVNYGTCSMTATHFVILRGDNDMALMQSELRRGGFPVFSYDGIFEIHWPNKLVLELECA